jgi:hypothetical protein
MPWIYLYRYGSSTTVNFKNINNYCKVKETRKKKKKKEKVVNSEYFPIIISPILHVSCSNIFSKHYGKRKQKKLAFRRTYIFACAPTTEEEVRRGTEQNSISAGYLNKDQNIQSLKFQVVDIVKKPKLNKNKVNRIIIKNKKSMFQKFRRQLTKEKNALSTDIIISLLGHGTDDGKLDLLDCEVPLDEILRFFKKAHHRYKVNITVILAMCYSHKYSISEFYDESGFKVIPLTDVKKPCTIVKHEVTGEKCELRVLNSVHTDLSKLFDII